MIVQEGAFTFDFSRALHVEKLDEQRKSLPEGMSFVDFVVEESPRLLLIEVKNPEGAPAQRRSPALREFEERMKTDTLIHKGLVPKARDSYCFLHLMARDAKPMSFVLVLGVGDPDPALLLGFKSRLEQRLLKESEKPWARKYMTSCVVCTSANWNRLFPHYPLTIQPS